MPDSVPAHVAEAVDQGEPAPPRKNVRGRFIPVGRRHLEALLVKQLRFATSIEQLAAIRRVLEAAVHRESHERIERMKTAYAVFDPDSDVIAWRDGDADPQAAAEAVFCGLRELLEKANYRAMPRDDVDAAVTALSPWGLNLEVELDIFDHLEVYCRGEKIDHRTRRSWATFMRLKHYRIPLYQRLLVVFRPKGKSLVAAGYSPDKIYLKLFKNIPEGDVDMVLPGTRVRMTLLDRGKFLFPLFSGAAVTGWKIIKGALIVAAVGVYGLLAYVTLIVGTIGYGWRSFFGYQRTKEKYQLSLTQNLYYQKLDGNLGALLRLADEAEDQEYREALSAWFLLRWVAPLEGWHVDELDAAAERWLSAELERDVDFDVHDAADKLTRWQLIDVATDGRLTAREPTARSTTTGLKNGN